MVNHGEVGEVGKIKDKKPGQHNYTIAGNRFPIPFCSGNFHTQDLFRVEPACDSSQLCLCHCFGMFILPQALKVLVG